MKEQKTKTRKELQREYKERVKPSGVFQIQNRFRCPVKVIGDERYLLIQRLEGVAYNPPTPASSTSNSAAHLGQTVSILGFPLRLMRL